MKAVETMATIENKKKLILDKPLSDIIQKQNKVRVILLLPDESDISENEWLHLASKNTAFDFLKEPAENIYTLSDGKPFSHER